MLINMLRERGSLDTLNKAWDEVLSQGYKEKEGRVLSVELL